MSINAQLTRNQSLVFASLKQADGPLSAYSILDDLRQEGLRAPLQVYRALEKLQDFGLVHRLESLNAFVACCHSGGEHKGTIAFAICNGCGEVTEFSDKAVSATLAEWAKTHNFTAQKTVIEISGKCKNCLTN